MSAGALMMLLAGAMAVGSLAFILYSMARSISNEKSRGIFRDFGLSIALMSLFFTTWIAQGIVQWQQYTDEELEHGQTTSIGDFAASFGQATLENWQSEFLQLFAFVTLAALFIHKGSAESKDGTEKLEASLRRLEQKMGTLPDDAPDEPKSESWKLPDTPLKLSG